jgi:hypothetical protein
MQANNSFRNGKMIWGYLVHLSFNMWADREASEVGEYAGAQPYLRFEMSVWDEILRKMAESGLNMVVLDLGDAVKYESHPEIAVRGAWSVGQLRQELAKARRLGIEPIPKLNFSTTHDTWLGPYSRCVSTDTYYGVCRDLVAEVIRAFDKPRFFHLGMDEETTENQRDYEHLVVRQYDLWWKDLFFLIDAVEKAGARPWIWSDYIWHHPEVFLQKMPKSVLQSNWYYAADFGENVSYVKAFLDLEAHAYDQVPTGSNWSCPENFSRLVAYSRNHIAPERLFGFLQTSWKPTLRARRLRHLEAVDLVGQVVAGQPAGS